MWKSNILFGGKLEAAISFGFRDSPFTVLRMTIALTRPTRLMSMDILKNRAF
jgi:hypothetical protein